MSTEKKVPIPARIYNASQGGHVAGAVDIIDDNKNKTQATINAEVDTTFAIHQNEINGLSRQNYVSVNAYSALPSPGNVETIYRVSSWDGKANDSAGAADVTKYSEYAWYNGAYILMDVKSQIGEVFDISAYNSNIEYADLAEALGTNGTNVPVSVRKGGMSIKFIQSSDNKYVQYRLMSDTFNTTPANWQGIDDEPTSGSNNLVKSGGVYSKTRYYFSPVWRDDRKIFYDYINHKLVIRGQKKAPTSDPALLIFKHGDVNYTISDIISEKNVEFVQSGNAGFFLPISSTNITYTLDDIVKFEDNNEHSGYIKIAHIIYKREVVSDIIQNLYSRRNFAITDDADNLHTRGVYRYIDNNNEIVLLVSFDGNRQTRMWQDNELFYIQQRTFENNQWSDWKNYIDSYIENPILNHQANQEIWWRGTARLFWNAKTKELYWSEGTTGDTDGTMIILTYKGRSIRLSASVKSRNLSGLSGNVQLFLPVPSDDTTSYTLNDIIVQTNNNPYNENQYVKIAHISYGNALSSFIIDSSQLDQKIDFVVEKTDVDIASLNPNFNYNDFVIIDGNILNTGILGTYHIPGERAAFFFKMPENNRPPVISGCTVLAYQWYSGFPDYVSGSNSLGRTTTNTPPENAKYGGITLSATAEHSNITIRPLYYDKDTINLYGSYLNNSIGENCFANGVRTNLKILGYGNSFMRNSVHYLSSIAKGCGVNLTVGNLYTGGTQLANHYNALLNNTNPYEWHKYIDGQNTVNQYNQTALRGLLDERWDAIILHQYTPWDNPFEPVFNMFIKLIIEKLGYCPKIYINATWAGSLDNNQTYYGFATEEEMWQTMLDNVKQACKDSGVAEFSIIPTGTAIQNARTLSWADDYNRFVNSGTDWHHLNPAGGFIAACTVFQKIITPLNGIPCSNTTFRITSATNLPPQTTIEQGILVTDDNYLSMCQAAIAAVNNPSVITTIIEGE